MFRRTRRGAVAEIKRKSGLFSHLRYWRRIYLSRGGISQTWETDIKGCKSRALKQAGTRVPSSRWVAATLGARWGRMKWLCSWDLGRI